MYLLISCSPESIAKTDLNTLQDIFKDDKIAKRVFNAAKRVMKKRNAAGDDTDPEQPSPKRMRTNLENEEIKPSEFEAALSLPISSMSVDELSEIVLITNRAPLALAFAFCVLRYTMPEQPVSSRLSLAQAVVSANSRSKAISIGIESGKSAEEEGWGDGMPVVKVLGRKIRVLKRWGYDPRVNAPEEDFHEENVQLTDGSGIQSTQIKSSAADRTQEDEANPQLSAHSGTSPLWGVDLEAQRVSNRRVLVGSSKPKAALPIFTAESARAYLLKSFTKATQVASAKAQLSKRSGSSQQSAETEECLGCLLRSIDIVCQSWTSHLNRDELDRRAWTWYLSVRPDVQSGASGWGEKGPVKLSSILALRRGS